MRFDKDAGRRTGVVAQSRAQQAETTRLGGVGKARLRSMQAPVAKPPRGGCLRRFAGKPGAQEIGGQLLQNRKLVVGG